MGSNSIELVYRGTSKRKLYSNKMIVSETDPFIFNQARKTEPVVG